MFERQKLFPNQKQGEDLAQDMGLCVEVSRSVWQGIKTLTGYRDSYTADNSGHRTLADSLNHFFSRFDCQIAADICHPC